jgi:hypothetical protein
MQFWNTRSIRVAVLAAACVLVALPATALGQDTSLEDRVNQLQARVDALEARLAALEGPPAPVAPAPPPQLLVDANGSDDAQTNRFSVDAGSLQMCWDVSLAPGSSKPTYITFTVHSVNPSGNVAESLVTTAESKCTQVRVDSGTYYVGVNQVEPGSWHLTVKPS